MIRTVRAAARCYHAADWQLSRLRTAGQKRGASWDRKHSHKTSEKHVAIFSGSKVRLRRKIQCATYPSTMTQEEREINGLGGRVAKSLRSSQSTTSRSRAALCALPHT